MTAPSDNNKKDFLPYTIPYSSSGAVRIGDDYVPSSQAVGDSTKVSSAFPAASVPDPDAPGSVRPPNAAFIAPPTTNQPSPTPNAAAQDASANTAGLPAAGTASATTTTRDRAESASSVGHVFTGAADVPIQEVPPTRFQQQPQFPSSYVGLNK